MLRSRTLVCEWVIIVCIIIIIIIITILTSIPAVVAMSKVQLHNNYCRCFNIRVQSLFCLFELHAKIHNSHDHSSLRLELRLDGVNFPQHPTQLGLVQLKSHDVRILQHHTMR